MERLAHDDREHRARIERPQLRGPSAADATSDGHEQLRRARSPPPPSPSAACRSRSACGSTPASARSARGSRAGAPSRSRAAGAGTTPFAADPATPLPFSTSTLVFDGGGAGAPSASASSRAPRRSPPSTAWTSGMGELVERLLDVRRVGARLAVAGHALDLVLEEVAAREAEREAAASSARPCRSGLPPTSTLLRQDRARSTGAAEAEVVRELLLERAHELLLARDPVVVVVGVAVADEVERLLAGEELVAGLEVDVRVVLGRRCRC